MKPLPYTLMFRKGLLATAMTILTFPAVAGAGEKPVAASVVSTWVVADPAASVEWLENGGRGFEEEQTGDEGDWSDSEDGSADSEDGWADFEEDPEGFEDGEDGVVSVEDDWFNWEDSAGEGEDSEEGWEGTWEYEDYLAESGVGLPYAGEFSDLFRAFSAGGKSAIPGGWETADRLSAKVQAVAKFAVRKQNHLPSTSMSEIELGRVLYARQQVVSGVNYSVRLEVKHEGLTKIARAKVWFRPGAERPYKLLKWTWLPAADKVKR